MSDINFVEVDAGTIQQDLINDFQDSLGVNFNPSDERLMFLQQETPVIVGLKNSINDSAQQNLLRYARDEVLNALGEFYGERGKRLAAETATVPLHITLSAVQPTDYTILKDDIVVTPDGKLDFIGTADVVIPSGQLTADTIARAADVGAKFNGFTSGQIKNIVKPIPYVASIVNTDFSAGGADVEENENYRERIRLVPESFSTAGPEGAYIFWAKTADSTIVDVNVDSPSPCVVMITVLLKDGGIPTQDILDKVLAILSSKDKRPLTDHVHAQAAAIVSYDIELTYYLDKDQATNEKNYRQAIEGKNLDCGADSAVAQYVSWQQSALGLAISPDMLRYFIQAAALYQSQTETKTAVKRIDFTAPVYTEITGTQVAKVGTITVTYGGLK
ncbi:baseplate J/gp47 family protein [Desulfosporosinus sp. OT]|uniref:baseplate assembly protein n=1 Tax=Desulfosporosinus sp. OT TaxID=913865 RepID=UPI000223A5CE|nr:baseplate J/gp47 family protein [Desulfosporosinus sp. OT]EGW39155.1 baseplate J-like family protein [Desulfosporosinus sp. OT]